MGWLPWGRKKAPQQERASTQITPEQQAAKEEKAAEQKRRLAELVVERDMQHQERHDEMREQIMDTTGRKLYLRDRLQKLVPSQEWDEVAVSKVMTDQEIMQLPKMGNDELALRRMADEIADRVIRAGIEKRGIDDQEQTAAK